MPRTRVQKKTDGRYTICIPRGIAEAMDLEGVELEWRVESGERLSAKTVTQDDA